MGSNIDQSKFNEIDEKFKNVSYKEIESELDDLSNLYETTPITKDTQCGIWIIRPSFLQK